MQNISQRVKAVRQALGMSQGQFADEMHFSRNYISMVERGTSQPAKRFLFQLEILEKRSKLGNVTSIEQEPRRGMNPQKPMLLEPTYGEYRAGTKSPRNIPIISWAQAGESSGAFYEEMPDSWYDFIPTFCPDEKAIAVRVQGDSMEPEFREGNIVTIMPTREPRNQCLVVAKMRNDGVYFKLFHEEGQGDQRVVTLSSYNEIYKPMICPISDFQWIYPAWSATKFLWG